MLRKLLYLFMFSLFYVSCIIVIKFYFHLELEWQVFIGITVGSLMASFFMNKVINLKRNDS